LSVGELGTRPARVIDDRDAESVEPSRNRQADPAHAEKADRAVAQRRAAERIVARRPFAVAKIALCLRQLAHGAEEEADRRVGDFFRENVRRIGDDDAAPARRDRVDVVIADAEA
jgi:hypothetical protein